MATNPSAIARTGRTARPAAANDAAPSRALPLRDGEVDVVITPDAYDRRVDRLGRPYAWMRGTLVERRLEQTRTVMAQGEAYDLVAHLLGIGTSIRIAGVRHRIVDKVTGRPGAEIVRLMRVLQVYDAQGREIDATTGRPLDARAAHDRVGHYRRQRHGPGNSLVKIIWVDETRVAGRAAA